MPIYEYLCGKCGTVFEHLARTGKDTPGKCPKCGGVKISKQFSTFSAAVHDHGGGCEGGSCGLSGPGPACSSCPGSCSMD